MVSIKLVPLLYPVLVLIVIAAAGAQTPAASPPSASLTSAPPPSTSLTPEQRGDIYTARKMFREAIAIYKTAPLNSPVIWNKIGIAWHNLGEMNLARDSYEHALKIDKKYAEAINNLGTVYYAEKRYRTAIGRYKKAIAIAPDKATFWSNLGTAYYSRGKFPLMMEAYNKAIALDPQVFEYRGFAGTEMQDRTVSDRARYHFELARLYAKIGKDDLALQYLRHSFEEGFKDKDKVRKAPEFSGMLNNPAFLEVMALEPRVL